MRLMLVMAFLLAGCASSTKQGPAGASPTAATARTPAPASDGDDEECTEEAPTGSHIQHAFCRDKMEREGNRKEAQDWMLKSRSSPTAVH